MEGFLAGANLVVRTVRDRTDLGRGAALDSCIPDEAHVRERGEECQGGEGPRDESGAGRKFPGRVAVENGQACKGTVLDLLHGKADGAVGRGVTQTVRAPGLVLLLHAVEGVVYAAFQFQDGLCLLVTMEGLYAFALDHPVERGRQNPDDDKDDNGEG